MRISDWNSDVCSSDLLTDVLCKGGIEHHGKLPPLQNLCNCLSNARTLAVSCCEELSPRFDEIGQHWRKPVDQSGIRRHDVRPSAENLPSIRPTQVSQAHTQPLSVDRKSAVQGKSVSVRVVLGGRRIIQKKQNKK